ncbi:CRISPR-associated endoribonuclease Cas6 [Botryobacter ruber]|uniref:CRISPR-associated endoribonuclease Cas6 n=1 Tax=Botryobacter ruber TaxID=2171629 RepID=UPI000E0B18E6|nr:CRISPR-associated endoribonuclease Cas6 [Botryobacter ruber]
MRIQLKLSPNTQQVPFNHLHELTKRLHHWLGPENELHDGLSLYSFGWLRGGERIGNGLWFPNGSSWNISFHESEQGINLVKGILADRKAFFGMEVDKALEMPYPNFFEKQLFKVDGAVVARKLRDDKTKEYLLFDNPEADDVLTRVLRKKMLAAGFSNEETELTHVKFLRDNKGNPRVRKLSIKGIDHKGSSCPVIVEGTPASTRFAWLVGIGELTGSGFGALQ